MLFRLTLLACIGCSADYECRDILPNQCQQTDFAWWRMAGEGDPPLVLWETNPCPKHPEATSHAVIFQGECYAGLFFREEWEARIAWTPPQAIYETALVHELQHAAQWRRGIEDGAHRIAEDWELVDVINSELRETPR